MYWIGFEIYFMPKVIRFQSVQIVTSGRWSHSLSLLASNIVMTLPVNKHSQLKTWSTFHVYSSPETPLFSELPQLLNIDTLSIVT